MKVFCSVDKLVKRAKKFVLMALPFPATGCTAAFFHKQVAATLAKEVFLDIAKSDYIPYAYLYDVAEKQWYACDVCQDCGFAFLNDNYLQTHV